MQTLDERTGRRERPLAGAREAEAGVRGAVRGADGAGLGDARRGRAGVLRDLEDDVRVTVHRDPVGALEEAVPGRDVDEAVTERENGPVADAEAGDRAHLLVDPGVERLVRSGRVSAVRTRMTHAWPAVIM